jgi:hypothetical protein
VLLRAFGTTAVRTTFARVHVVVALVALAIAVIVLGSDRVANRRLRAARARASSLVRADDPSRPVPERAVDVGVGDARWTDMAPTTYRSGNDSVVQVVGDVGAAAAIGERATQLSAAWYFVFGAPIAIVTALYLYR